MYLSGFAQEINSRYWTITGRDHIAVYGAGKNTAGLLRFVDRMAQREWSGFDHFWLVYDKDDFPRDQFDNTQFSAEGRAGSKIRVAWSNECIELWFLLHFQDYEADNGRKQYAKLLRNYFDYKKSRKDLYEILKQKGSLEAAIRRAKRLLLLHQERGIKSPSAMVPATRMHELVEELIRYLPDDFAADPHS